jgi:hypothetical protein
MNNLTLIPAFFSRQDMIVVLVSMGFLLLIFLALRAILLWYWKVDIIVKNQEEQIRLLNELLIQTIKNNKV